MSKRRSCTDCTVRHGAICGPLPREQLSRLGRVAYQRRYSAGQFIAGAGQKQDWYATILSGVVKLTKAMPDGRQQIVGLLFEQDFLGRPFARASSYGAEAATTVDLCCLERPHFEELMQSCPQMKQLFLERTLNEVDAAREWMLLLGRKTAREKVASLILLLAQRMPPPPIAHSTPGPGLHLELPLSRADIAEYLGLRLETVSRQIQYLRETGIVDTKRRRGIVVHDIAELARLAVKELS